MCISLLLSDIVGRSHARNITAVSEKQTSSFQRETVKPALHVQRTLFLFVLTWLPIVKLMFSMSAVNLKHSGKGYYCNNDETGESWQMIDIFALCSIFI